MYTDPSDPRKKASKLRWYYRNRKKVLEGKYRRRKRNRDFVKNIKKGKKCVDCKKEYPFYAMDFDHRDKKKKRETVSRLVHDNVPIEDLKKEIAKCDLVCSNCHRVRTYGAIV